LLAYKTSKRSLTLELALEILPQVLLDGLVLGFMYALIALGYTMVYGVLEFINFAHSEIFVLGAFVGVEVLLWLEDAGHLAVLHPAFVLSLVIAAGMLISGLAAMALERVAYRPLQGSPRLVALISAIGASFFLQDALRLLESVWRNTFYLNYPSLDMLDQLLPLATNLAVPVKSLMVIVTALLSLAGLHYFVNRTRIGTAIRAVAQDPETASLMGIPVNRVIALTFFVGGAMGGLAGVLFGLHYSLVNPYSGFAPGIKAFTAAVLGGIGNIPGAMLGGMVLGLLEAFAASYLSLLTDGAFGAEYKDVFAFLVLIMILIFRPKGLLGETVREGRA
jgi:branched-chain amino acid transport system permease protein